MSCKYSLYPCRSPHDTLHLRAAAPACKSMNPGPFVSFVGAELGFCYVGGEHGVSGPLPCITWRGALTQSLRLPRWSIGRNVNDIFIVYLSVAGICHKHVCERAFRSEGTVGDVVVSDSGVHQRSFGQGFDPAAPACKSMNPEPFVVFVGAELGCCYVGGEHGVSGPLPCIPWRGALTQSLLFPRWSIGRNEHDTCMLHILMHKFQDICHMFNCIIVWRCGISLDRRQAIWSSKQAACIKCDRGSGNRHFRVRSNFAQYRHMPSRNRRGIAISHSTISIVPWCRHLPFVMKGSPIVGILEKALLGSSLPMSLLGAPP